MYHLGSTQETKPHQYWNRENLIQRIAAAAAAAKSLQSCLTLCDPMDSSPPGSPVPGILQARTLEWVAISFSNDESEKWKRSRSVVSDSQGPQGLQHQAPPSMGFSRQEYWSGVPLPSLKELLAIQNFSFCIGQGGLACYSLWGCKEYNTTEWLNNNNIQNYQLDN